MACGLHTFLVYLPSGVWLDLAVQINAMHLAIVHRWESKTGITSQSHSQEVCQHNYTVTVLPQFAVESETGSDYGLPEQLANTLRNRDDIGIQGPDGPRLRQLHFLAGERDGGGAHDLGGTSQAGECGIHQGKPSVWMYLQHARINQKVEQQQSRVHICIKVKTALAVCVNTETGDEVGGNQRSHRRQGQRATGGLEGHAIGAPLFYGPEEGRVKHAGCQLMVQPDPGGMTRFMERILCIQRLHQT